MQDAKGSNHNRTNQNKFLSIRCLSNLKQDNHLWFRRWIYSFYSWCCWWKKDVLEMRVHQNIHIFGFQWMCLLLACDLKSLSGGEDEAAVLHLSLPFKAILISPILLKFETIAFLPGQWNRTMTSFYSFLYFSLYSLYILFLI